MDDVMTSQDMEVREPVTVAGEQMQDAEQRVGEVPAVDRALVGAAGPLLWSVVGWASLKTFASGLSEIGLRRVDGHPRIIGREGRGGRRH
jgi:hypothetical protein